MFWRQILLLAVAGAGALGEPLHMIDYLLPRGGTRGTTVEVTFHGRGLQEPKEVLFYQPGIKAVGFSPGSKPAEELNARFEIAPDCPLGEHVLRLRTATELGDAVTFWVGPFPTILETGKKPQLIPLNSTVEGQILPGPAMDIDVYSVDVQRGQRISVEVESVRLGALQYGPENDLAVRILDSDGRELGRNDDNALYVQDPVLSIRAPHDGRYLVEIKQQVFFSIKQGWYRAHIGSFSRPTGIFPAGGQAGTTIAARILGDPAGERTESIVLPAQSGSFNYFGSAPSPNVLRVSPYPNVLSVAGDKPTQVDALPAALNGVLTEAGQVDTYRFAAKKSESWHIRVYARTLGSPMDPKIWIRPINDAKSLLEADDAKLTELGLPSSYLNWLTKDLLDPVAVFRPPADGEYLLGIEDTRGSGGQDSIYRVEIELVRDTIYTHITGPEGYQLPRLLGLVIPQGNRWTLDVQLAEGFGNTYKGAVELEAVGLPKGVSMIAPRFAKGVTRLPVQFVAASDAEPQAALVELRARPVENVPLETGSRQGFGFTNHPGGFPLHCVFVDKYALAVTQPAPFSVELEQPAIPLVQSGELALNVTAVRHGNFQDPIEIQIDWLPPGVSREGTVTIPAGQTKATVRLGANPKAAVGAYKIALSGSTIGGDAYSGVGRIRVSSPFIDLRVSEPYFTIDLKRSSISQGQRGEVAAVLHQNKRFSGKATLSLQNLPVGVTLLKPVEITAQDTEVVFQIAAAGDALAGLYKNVACDFSVVDGGQEIKQRNGSGVLRIDPAKSRVAIK